MPTVKLHALDGARGIAAVAVVLYHLGQWTENRWIMSHGYLAVDFFFCLSGFVVAYAYGRKLEGEMSFGEFVKVRLIRLYPIIFLGTLMGFAVYLGLSELGSQPFTSGDVIAALRGLLLIPFLFASSPVGAAIYPLNSPFWSIFYELISNFVWAAFLRRIPVLPMFGVMIVLALLFYRNPETMSVGGAYNEFHIGLLRVFLSFVAGLAVYDLLERQGSWPTLTISPWVPLAILAFIMAAPHAWGGTVFDLLCAIIVFPVLTAVCACVAQGEREDRFMKWLGDVSYPLYGIHRPLCQAIVLVLAKVINDPILYDIATFTAGLVLSLVASTLVFRFYDVPVRAFFRPRRRPITEQAAP